jgi:hypothetical protein
MKKVFISLCFTLIGMTGMAQSHTFCNASNKNDVDKLAISQEHYDGIRNIVNASSFVSGKVTGVKDGIKTLSVSEKVNLMKTFNTQHSKKIIRDPKGTPKMYSLKTFVKDGESNAGVLDGYCDTIYFDGNDVYFKNFVIPVRDGSFVKGTITQGDMHNGRISIPIGQEVAAGYRIIQGALDEDGSLTADTITKAFTFKIINDTIISDSVASTQGAMYVLAVNTKTGECDQYNAGYKYYPISASDLERHFIPSDVVMKKYLVKSKNIFGEGEATEPSFYIGNKGNDFYLRGFVNDSTIAVKGLRDGDKIKFRIPQFLTIHDGILYFLRVGRAIKSLSESGDSTLDIALDNVDSITFDYNEKENTFACHDLLVTTSGFTLITYINKPRFQPFNYKTVVVPSTAVTTEYMLDVTDEEKPKVHKHSKVRIARDGNDFYFLDLYENNKDAAAKGTLEGDSIVINFPQYYGPLEADDVFMYDGVVNTVSGSAQEFNERSINTSIKQLKLSYNAKTGEIKSKGALAIYRISGAIWNFYNRPKFTPFTEKKAVVPTDAEVTPMIMTTSSFDGQTQTQRIINIAKKDNTFYFLNHSVTDTTMLFKGELKDGKIHVATPQYLGGDKFVYLYSARLSSHTEDGETTYYYDIDSTATEITFDYDEATKTIHNNGLMMFMTLDGAMDNFFYKPSYSPYIAKAGTPANPDIDSWNPYYYSSLGENLFTVLITTKNTNGEFIDPNNLTYRIYMDNDTEPFVFTPEEYDKDFTVNTTDIPFNHVGTNISNNIYHPEKRILWLYETPKERIGVQTTYTYNGVSNSSSIVYINIATGQVYTGIHAINADNDSEVSDVKYFNAVGMRILKPMRGMNIVVKTFKNGVEKTMKVWVK